MLIIHVAIDENKGIGKNGSLPWHLKDDLKLFKRNTLHHSVLMGQTTYDNMPVKLKKRHTIVCTIDPQYTLDEEDTEVIYDLKSFLEEHQYDEEEIFVAGGASIYRQAYPYCQKAYISFVKGEHDVDTYFSVFDMNDWEIEKEEDYGEFIYRELKRKEKNEIIPAE